MKKQISVLLVDDHQMFRDSLIDFLGNEFACKEVRGAATVAEARTLIEATAPDVAICDLNFPGEESGYDLIEWIRNRYPQVGVLCLTMNSELQVLREVAKREVRGFVTKSSGYNELFHAVRSVATGGYYLDQVLLEKVMKDMGRSQGGPRRESDRVSTDDTTAVLAELTAREREIFLLFVQGATLNAIADELYLSPKTVENHRSNIYRKLNVHDRLSLVGFAREHGLDSNTR
ncbi:MAG: DNA-binding response regulator [Spirochaetaceae bacterium]|nr:MAG: DNA-binding response regulator [Spirochaetaceae bacterium]